FITEDRPQPTLHADPVDIGAPPSIRAEAPVPRGELQALLREVGAAAVLQPTQGAHGTLFVLGNRETGDDAVPSVLVAGEHYNLLVRQLERGLPVRLRVGVTTRWHTADTFGYNVIAEIRGTDPALGDEVVMAGAHLDSWHSATGATDNA